MRISSTGTKMYVQSGALPAGTAVVSATKAAPCVLTFAALPPGVALGDVVVVSGSGWRSLDNRPFEVGKLDAAAFGVTLYDSDTSGEEAAFAAGAKLAEVAWVEFCVGTLTLNSPAGTNIDVTTLCDDARETIPGMPAISTWSETGFWDADDAVQDALRLLYRKQLRAFFKVVFQDESGLAFFASVNTFDIRAGVDQAVATTIGGALSGPSSMLRAPADIVIAAEEAPEMARAAA